MTMQSRHIITKCSILDVATVSDPPLSFMDSEIMSRIIKADINDHLVIFSTIEANEKYPSNDVTTFKRDTKKYKNHRRSFFKNELRKMRNSTKNIKSSLKKSRKTLRNYIIKIS